MRDTNDTAASRDRSTSEFQSALSNAVDMSSERNMYFFFIRSIIVTVFIFICALRALLIQ